MILLADSSLSASPGHFGAVVSETQKGDEVTHAILYLPEGIVGAFASWDVRDAITMLSYTQCFPSTVSKALGWTVPETLAALAEFKETLRGHLGEDLVSMEAPRGYGALDPKDRPCGSASSS